ncbi:DUF721 domain-containing protein [uncultured Fibrobacter sp.]|uniref:DUF721 domain-containing protein n=1 Tax=uncultured Fibrobacter sp. TaxID=261512 RepID=UPI002591894F|nr:DUF721 domain-containing protein [uncultured Fibrobacter sp.]
MMFAEDCPKKRRTDPKEHKLKSLTHAGVILAKVLSAGALGEKQYLFKLVSNIETLFGKPMSEHLKIVDLQDSVLVLKASNSVWKSESAYQKKAIIERCNGLLGVQYVKNIRFV